MTALYLEEINTTRDDWPAGDTTPSAVRFAYSLHQTIEHTDRYMQKSCGAPQADPHARFAITGEIILIRSLQIPQSSVAQTSLTIEDNSGESGDVKGDNKTLSGLILYQTTSANTV